jgi:Ni/Co efflux regulator RcnB
MKKLLSLVLLAGFALSPLVTEASTTNTHVRHARVIRIKAHVNRHRNAVHRRMVHRHLRHHHASLQERRTLAVADLPGGLA